MSTELGRTDVDPSDPRSTLLSANNRNSNNNNSAIEEDDSDAVAQDQDQLEDWSKFGSLWSPHLASSIKSYNDFMDLSDFSSSVTMSMPMDTDLGIAMGMDYPYSSMMGIDPASLHFNPAAANFGLGGGFGLAQDVSTSFTESYGASAAGFGFQQQQQQNSVIAPLFTQGSSSPESFTKERRLSVTSSSSSSVTGASLSPVPNHYNTLSPPPSGYTSDNVSTKDEPNSNSTSETMNSHPNANDPAAELAHRVRQSAGVMLAVPVNGFGSSFQAGANASASKLPIRLNRSSTTTMYAKSTTTSAPLSSSSSTASSAASTPPPTTPPSTSHSPLSVSTSTSAASASVPTPSTSGLPRPKTSHTTIERRYRTNLNARIQSLRMAVPALRVLEDEGKKIKKNIKGGVIVKGGGIEIGVECSEDGSVVDVIDERGFVDGVKVARKCSKANVLGKAVEYIRVLKRREKRLKAELAGVKVLVEGLVGGPVLIREWEKQWRARFGGEEKDEVEEDDEEAEGEDEESDDEDGEDGDEEGAGRKRKRARVTPTSTGGGMSKKVDNKKEKKTALSSPVVLLAGGNPVPEKRKRGRPRKILPPPVTLEPVATTSASVSGPAPALLPSAVILNRGGLGSVKQDEVAEMPSQWQQQPPPQRFLLAVFALFSFFNSPLTASMGRDHSHNHHMGKVLTPLHPPLVYSPEIVSQYPPVDTLSTAPIPVWKHYVQLFHLAVSFIVLASLVGNWFGFGVSGFRFTFERRGWGWKLGSSRTGKGDNDKRGKGNVDWIGFAEDKILSGEASSLSLFERFQIYRAISDKEGASLGSLVTAAIALKSANDVVFGGLARMKASVIWDDARRKVQSNNQKVKVKEEFVFGSMSLDEACERLADFVKRGDSDEMSDGEREYELIEILACGVVKERVRSHLGRMFVDFVGGHEDEEDEDNRAEEERRRRRTVDASRELGGSVEEMGRLFERIWKIGVGSVEMGDVECAFSNVQDSGGVNEEVRALFVAFVLYARLFGGASSESSEETETETDGGLSSSSDTVIVSNSSLLSPPPSPTKGSLVPSKIMSSKRAKMMLELRRVLGCRVFEGCVGKHEVRNIGGGGVVEGLEDARDLVVDFIVDFERKDR